jgi:AcrR family transcriptional regulator
MARKAILEGGKRDELIEIATKQFFTKGYDGTSVRSILEEANGEVGMFYHYFKSKDELFQIVVERFFDNYKKRFYEIVSECNSEEDFVEKLLKFYQASMLKFNQISDAIHWTIKSMLSARTIHELLPAVTEAIQRIGYRTDKPLDIAMGQYLYSISATVHSDSFIRMSFEEQKKEIMEIGDRLFTKMINNCF